MRGLHTSLVIVVAAIVILIVALVVLTIFGVGITPIRTIADATAQCDTLGKASCITTGALPATWETKAYKIGNELKSCYDVKKCNTCSTCEYSTGTTTPARGGGLV